MNRTMIYGLALALAAPLCAQGVLYSPKNLDTKTEGEQYAYYFARYSQGHMQNVDAENSGKAGVITAINMRIDAVLNHGTSTSQGRKWSNVQVSIGEGDFSQFGSTFASNFTTTPTTVFNKAWSLPSFTGTSTTSPAVYGGPTGEYRVPFSTTWVYTGKGDIVHDWVYQGGTLDNAVNWTSTSSRTYYLDSYRLVSPTSSVGSTSVYLPTSTMNTTSTQQCNDTAHTSATGAYILAVGTYYGKWYSVESYRNKLLFYTYSYYTAYEAPVLHAISLTNSTTGVDLGTTCQRLHVQAPMVVVPRVTLPREATTSAWTGYNYTFTKWNPRFNGISLTIQGAWADSGTSKFNLTRARVLTLPTNPDAPPPMRWAAFSSSNTATTGSTSNSHIYNPAFAYETK